MSSQQNTAIYRKFIESLQTTYDSVLFFDENFKFFKAKELKKLDEPDDTIDNIVYDTVFTTINELFINIPQDIQLRYKRDIDNVRQNQLNTALTQLIGNECHFDIKKKIVWIVLMVLAKSCPLIISPLLKQCDDVVKLIIEEDDNGNNLISHTCCYMESLIEILKHVSPILMFQQNKLGVSPMDIMISQGNIGLLVDYGLVDLKQLIEYNKQGLNILHLTTLFGNERSLEYLLHKTEIDPQLLITFDSNMNTPAVIACIINLDDPSIALGLLKIILTSNKYTSKAFTTLNADNKNVFSYGILNLVPLMFEYDKLSVDFIINNYKLFTDYFKNNIEQFETLVKSNYFIPEVIYKPSHSILELMINHESKLIDKYGDKTEYAQKMIMLLKDTFKIAPHYFGLFAKNYPIKACSFVKNNMLFDGILTIELENTNTYQHIIKKYYTEPCNVTEQAILIKLLTVIFDSKYFEPTHLNIICNNSYLLTFSYHFIKKYFVKFLADGVIAQLYSRKAILECFTDKDQTKYDLKECMIKYKTVDSNFIKENNYIIMNDALRFDPMLAAFILSNHILFEEIPNNDVIISWLRAASDLLLFKKLVSHHLVKSCVLELEKLYENIVPEQMKIIFEERTDFDDDVLYDGKLLDYILKKESYNKLSLILKRKTLAYDYYLNLFKILPEEKVVNKELYLNLLLDHELFGSDTLEKVKYNGSGENLLMTSVRLKLPNVIKILESSKLTESIFRHTDRHHRNILFYCITYNMYEKEIIGHKYFDKNMIFPKTIDGVNNENAKNLLQQMINAKYFNYDIIKYGIEKTIIKKKDIEDNNIIIINMVENELLNEVLDIAIFFNDKQLLLKKIMDKKDVLTNLEYLFSIKTSKKINIDKLMQLGFIKEDFQTDNCLKHMAENHCYIFAEIVGNMGFTKKDMITKDNNSLLSQGLAKDHLLYQKIPIGLLLDGELLKHKLNNEMPTIFMTQFTFEFFCKLMEEKSFDVSCLVEIYQNETYLEKLFKGQGNSPSNESFGIMYFADDRSNFDILFDNTNRLLIKIIRFYPELFDTVLKMQNSIKFNNRDLQCQMLTESINCQVLSDDNDGNIPLSFKYLIVNQTFDSSILMAEYKNKLMLTVLSKNQKCFGYMLSNTNNEVLAKTLFKRDNFGDPLIVYLRHNLQNFENIICQIKPEDLKIQNNCGQTILHHLATDDCLVKIISSPEILLKILEMSYIRDNFGKLYIDYAFEAKNVNNMMTLMHNKIIDEINIINVDKSGIPLFAKILANCQDSENYMKNMISNNLLAVRDRDGVNNLGHIIKHSQMLLEHICKNIDLLGIDIKLFDNVDNCGRTCLTLAVEYNSENLELLLKQKFITLRHFLSHKSLGSCLTKAIKFNPKCIASIMKSPVVKEYYSDIVNGRENDIYNQTIISMNIIQLACKYSSDALIFIINNAGLEELVYEIIGKEQDKVNSLKFAIMYQPDCIDTLLRSQYFNKDLIRQTNEICNVSCLIDSLQYQPASFLKLMRSEKLNHTDITYGERNPIEEFFRLIKSRKNNEVSLEGIEEKYPLLRFINEPCESDDKHKCMICYANKSKVLFSSCYHQACITCSLQVDKCHMCKTQIANRIPFNN